MGFSPDIQFFIFFEKFNSDDTVEVLSPSGDIYRSSPFGGTSPELAEATKKTADEQKPTAEPIPPETSRNVSTPTRGKKGLVSQSKQSNQAPALPDPVPMETIVQEETGNNEFYWHVIRASGEQWKMSGEDKESLNDLLVADASCFESDQVFFQQYFLIQF